MLELLLARANPIAVLLLINYYEIYPINCYISIYVGSYLVLIFFTRVLKCN